MVMTVKTGTLMVPVVVRDFYAMLAQRHNVDAEALMVEALRRIAVNGTMPRDDAEPAPAPRPAPIGPPKPTAARLPPQPRLMFDKHDLEPVTVQAEVVVPAVTVKRGRLSEADRARIIELHADGLTDQEIARELSRKVETVTERLRAAGLGEG